MIPRASSPDYSPNAEPTTGPSLLLLSSKQNEFRFFPNPPLNNKPISATTPQLLFLNDAHLGAIQMVPLGSPPFFFPLPPSPAGHPTRRKRAKRVLAIAVVSQNGPRRDIVLARTFARGKVPWENARDRNAEEKGVPSRSARTPTYVCTHHTLASLHGHPFRFGGAANQSFLREHDGRRR